MLEKLKLVEARYLEMAERAAQPDFYNDPKAASQLLKEQRQLEPIITAYRSYIKTTQEQEDLRAMLSDGLDPDMKALCQEEFSANKKKLEELEQELQASAEANIKGDTAAIITHDTRFHKLIIDAADNEYIAEISHMLVLHIQRIRYHFFHLPTMRRISASQHRGILDALRERDAQRAKTLMREHWLTSMNGSLKDTMESLRQAKASGPDETES